MLQLPTYRFPTAMLTFYDLACKTGEPWSINPWKTRLTLNYKGLPFKTTFVDFPDIAPLCKELGVPAASTKSDGVTPHYTVPFIHDDTTGRYVSDSLAIAEYLDETYPDTPQVVKKGTHGVTSAFIEYFGVLLQQDLYATLAVPNIFGILTPRGQAHVREHYLGGSEPPKPSSPADSEVQWAKVEKGVFGKVLKLYKNPEGLFLNGGDKPDFADLQIVACFQWVKAAFGTDSAEWKRIQGWHGGKWAKLDNELKDCF